MTRKMFAALSVIGLLMLGFVGSAFAQAQTLPDQESLLDLARPIFDAVMAGHYLAGAALGLVFAVALFKRYAPGKAGAFARSDAGGVTTTFAMSFFGAAATSLLAFKGWAGMSLAMVKMSAGVSFLAIGGYVGIKKFLLPLLAPYLAKLPAWMQPGVKLLLWVFDRHDPATRELAKAEAAGAAAVAAEPSKGAESVTGDPEKF